DQRFTDRAALPQVRELRSEDFVAPANRIGICRLGRQMVPVCEAVVVHPGTGIHQRDSELVRQTDQTLDLVLLDCGLIAPETASLWRNEQDDRDSLRPT